MSKIIGSVIIPVYNQYNKVQCILKGFRNQNVNMDDYEIIIVDDGSDDLLAEKNSLDLQNRFGLNIEIIHKLHKGRAAARNEGIMHSQSDYILFCDGDRIPHCNFIDAHLKLYSNINNIVIGYPYDYFGDKKELSKNELDWSYILKMSRLPMYYKKIAEFYQVEKNSNGRYIWLSFLVGNSSVNKRLIKCVGGFDETINEWGFEHFELGYRLYKYGAKFIMSKEAKSFHIPHAREKNFYNIHLKKSISNLHKKYPELDMSFLEKFFGVSG